MLRVPMDREAALALIKTKSAKDTTLRHLITVEAIMRRLGERFDQDADTWARAGLFHDMDMEQTHEDLSRHGYLSAEWLREVEVDEKIVNTVLAHAHPSYIKDLMSQAIVQADAVAGFLVACALVRPDKTTGMKVSSCRKKLKEKSFAPGVDRDEIHNCQEKIGLPLDEFLQLGIEGLQASAVEAGLI